jgi:hypothetical protein
MAGNSATLLIKIITDASGSKKGLTEAATGFEKFQSGAKSALKPALAVGGALLALGVTAVGAASDTEQAMGSLDSVFGDSAKAVKSWAADSVEAVGLTEAQYATMASGIGAQLKNLGLSQDESLKGTKSLISLGADLAATFGGDTEQAVGALAAALRGEADPAERYGLALNQTAVNAKLAEKGLKGLQGDALRTAKTQVILEMATQQAAGAVGQFGREADTAAGQTQRANAAWGQAMSDLGTALLPIVTAAASAFKDMAKWVSDNSDTALMLAKVIAIVVAAIIVLNVVLGIMSAIMAANPITWIVVGIIALIAVIVLLVLNWQKVVDFLVAGAKIVGDFFVKAFQAILAPVLVVFAGIRSAFAAFVAFWVGLWNGAVRVATAAWAAVSGAARNGLNQIIAAASSIGQFFANMWRSILDAGKSIWGAIAGAATAAGNKIMSVFRGVADFIKGIVNAISNAVGAAGKLVGIGKAAPAGYTAAYAPSSPTFGAYAGAGPVALSGGAGGAGVTIVVQGGLDSGDTIARRIRSILAADDRRHGGVTITRRAVSA